MRIQASFFTKKCHAETTEKGKLDGLISFKAGFHMIADDGRRSRIVDRRSQKIAKRAVSIIIIADDRSADCSHTFRSAEMSNVHASCARSSKFISSFSPKATTTSASKPKETSVLDLKNGHEVTK